MGTKQVYIMLGVCRKRVA